MIIKVYATISSEELLDKGADAGLSEEAQNILRYFNEVPLSLAVDPESGVVCDCIITPEFLADVNSILSVGNAHMSLRDIKLETKIRYVLKTLEEDLIACIGPTVLRHQLDELAVQMRNTLTAFDQDTYEAEGAIEVAKVAVGHQSESAADFVAMTTLHDKALVLKSDGSVYRLEISDEPVPHTIIYKFLMKLNNVM